MTDTIPLSEAARACSASASSAWRSCWPKRSGASRSASRSARCTWIEQRQAGDSGIGVATAPMPDSLTGNDTPPGRGQRESRRQAHHNRRLHNHGNSQNHGNQPQGRGERCEPPPASQRPGPGHRLRRQGRAGEHPARAQRALARQPERVVLFVDPDPGASTARPQKVLLRDMQRHPFKQQILHLDFQRVDENEAIRFNVPLHFLNQESLAGRQDRGRGRAARAQRDRRQLPAASDLPEFIEVDLSTLDARRHRPPVRPQAAGRRHPAGAEARQGTRRRRRDRAPCPRRSRGRSAGRRRRGRSAATKAAKAARSGRCRRLRRRRRSKRASAPVSASQGSGVGPRLAWLVFASSSAWAIPVPNTPEPGTTPGSGLLTPWRQRCGARFGLESQAARRDRQGRRSAGQNGLAAASRRPS